MKDVSKQTKIFKWASLVLLVAIFALQFIPFWNIEGESFSIQDYIWNEATNRTVTDYIKSFIGNDYRVSSLAFTAGVQLIAPAITFILYLRKSSCNAIGFFTFVTGVIGTWGFLTKPAFQLGTLWIVYLVIDILLVISSIMLFVAFNKETPVEE